MKKIILLVAILVLGVLAGTIVTLWLAPILADYYPFSKIDWLVRSKEGVTIVNKTERVTISENKAFQDGLAKTKPSMVGIRVLGKDNRILTEGNGFILTSDGLIASAAILVPDSARAIKVVIGAEELPASILKKDPALGAVLLKIEKTNLTPVALADLTTVFPAQEIFLLALDIQNNPILALVNRGYVRYKNDNSILVGFFQELSVANGSVSVNEKGEVVGMNIIGGNGQVNLIPINKITSLLNQ